MRKFQLFIAIYPLDTHYLAEISASPATVGRGSARRAYPLVVHIPVGECCAGGGGGGGRRQRHHLLKMPFMSIFYTPSPNYVHFLHYILDGRNARSYIYS